MRLVGQPRPRSIFLSSLSSLSPRSKSLSLQRGSTTVKDKYGFNAEEQEFTDSTEEAYDVGITEGLTFFVTDGFEELKILVFREERRKYLVDPY